MTEDEVLLMNKYIMLLLKSSIFDTNPPYSTLESVDWEYIYQKSEEQNIAGLLYYAISKLDAHIRPSTDIMTALNTKMLATVTTCTKQYAEFTAVNRLMRDNGIAFVGLKGCVLRNMYPVPELRTMGDFDVLVKEADLTKIREIFLERGYKIENDIYGIICKKGIVYWEIFTTIAGEFSINPEKWDKLYYSETTEMYGITCPAPTYFFLHLIIHTGKHLVGSGAGIRNFCDIALFLRQYKEEIDFNIIEEACREQGYFKVYEYIMAVMKQFWDIELDMKIPQKDVDALFDYMLLYGIYGKHDNSVVSQLIKRKNEDESFVRKLFFPSVYVLENRYKYLKKYPFLLPIAWVHRFFSGIFRLKYSVKQMINDTGDASKFVEERRKWLNKLDLRDK